MHSDIAIVGAGMVGASLVHLLETARQRGMTVTLLDQVELTSGATDEQPPGFDGRATALSYGTRQLFEGMNVWPRLAAACAIEHIQVSDQGHFGQTHLHASEQGTEALGYVVENHALGRGLLKNIDKLDGVDVLAPVCVERVQMNSSGARLTLDNNSILQTQLLVLADGGRSGLAASLGIGQQHKSYGTHALVTQIETDKPHQNWAYERFSTAGPVAFLPLGSHRYAVVWTVNDNAVDEYLALPDEIFLQRLQQQIGSRLGTFKRAGERSSYPLALIKSTEQVRRSLVLLGNAAHSLHPVAGQGFNLALRDAAVLAEHINRASIAGQSPGDLALLQSYQTQQQQDQHITTTASDALPRLFGHSNKAMAHARGIGLLGLAMAPAARQFFTRHAMGLGHRATATTEVSTNV